MDELLSWRPLGSQDDEAIRALMATPLTIDAIATRLETSKDRLKRRLRALGIRKERRKARERLPPRWHLHPATERELKFIHDNYLRLTVVEISQALGGRSKNSIIGYAHRMGLSKRMRRAR